ARYAAMVRLVDRWLGVLLDAMDDLGLWEDTMVVLTTDHGTFNGDHGRTGKFHGGTDTHNHEPVAHIPFLVAHPDYPGGQRRDQLVQLVDLYPTVLSALGREVPPDRHGVDLEPAIADPSADTREYAISGVFGGSVTITDGEWVLHQAPVAGNEPLYWYGLRGEHRDNVGPYEDGRRPVEETYDKKGTWLTDLDADPTGRVNRADRNPGKLAELQDALREALAAAGAPEEQFDRLGL
ncbi:MAG: sulfatase, partial [Halobacteriaceae archaeon]